MLLYFLQNNNFLERSIEQSPGRKSPARIREAQAMFPSYLKTHLKTAFFFISFIDFVFSLDAKGKPLFLRHPLAGSAYVNSNEQLLAWVGPIFPSQHGTLYREMSRDKYLNLLDVGSFQLLNLIALHVYKEGAIYSEVVLRRDSSWLLQEALGLNFYLMYAGSGT